MTKKNKLLLILIPFIAFLAVPVSAIIDGHKPVICFGCHGSFSYGGEDDTEGCGDCHNYVGLDNKLDKNLIEENHNPNTCKACHGVSESGAYHTIHINQSCNTCHGVTGNAKPDKSMTDCGGCHGGRIHEVHDNRLDLICTDCHGTRPSSNPGSVSGIIPDMKFTRSLYSSAVNYRNFTLFEVLKKLISSL